MGTERGLSTVETRKPCSGCGELVFFDPCEVCQHDDIVDVSLAWEAAHGYDSIATIERVYYQTPGGAFECIYPGCRFARRDPVVLWHHVHTQHGENTLPPDDFDPGPWL